MKAILFVSIATIATSTVYASMQPPVRYTVELRKAGSFVECRSADGTLGQDVRIPLSAGRTVVGFARPMGADGRSKITVRFEISPTEGGLEVAHEITNTFNLAQSSPSFTYRGDPEHFSYWVRVASPPLLATTRYEPDWRQHLDKFTPIQSPRQTNGAGERCVEQ